MHLKYIEVVGFKSFCDKVKLEFEPGITAVVGPNGCGKSNVIDAIRWCLGEMSAKSLRSNLMLDVIFNGSGARPPQHMAEVTLTFDNSDKRLPIDYNDVSVTRRLFRSGESEYYINKTQCRLRDIKELFLDTGMGEDGYSAMEQGRVEWVLNAKPEQRRELFEEAAGVSKYRTRREEAIRKLDRVEIDLSRISDIVTVTKEQIKKLENSVNRAKTYQRLKEDLKQSEISDWLWQRKSIGEDLATLHVRLDETSKRAEELNTQTHGLDAELSAFRLKLNQTEEELVKANTSLSAIDADIKINEERLSNAEQRETELGQQMASLLSNIERESGRLKDLQKQMETQTQALETSKTGGDSIELEFETSKKIFDETVKTLEEKKALARSARDTILERAQERARTQQQMAHATSDLSRIEAQLTTCQKEIEKLSALKIEHQANVKAVESELSLYLKEENEKASHFDSLSTEATSLSKRHDNLNQSLVQLSEQIAQLKGQLKSIDDHAAEDPYLSGVQALLSAGLKGITGPIGRLYECSELDKEILASALGEYMGDAVADTLANAEEAIKFLADHNKGRARIWVLEKLSISGGGLLGHFSGDDSLFSRIKTADQYRPVFKTLLSQYHAKGTTVYGNAIINGGVDPARWKSHALLRRPEMERGLSKKESEKKQLEHETSALLQQMDTIKTTRETCIRELEEAKTRKTIKLSEKESLEGKLKLVEEEINLINAEKIQHEKNQSQLKEKYERAKLQFESLQTMEKNDHESLDKLHQELTDLQQIHAVKNADLQSKTQKHQAFIEKLHWHESVVTHTQREMKAVEESVRHQKETYTLLSKEKDNSMSAQAEAKVQIESSMKKRDAAQDICFAIQKERTGISNEIENREGLLHETRTKLHDLQELIQTDKIQESTLKGKNETLVHKLLDQYEISLEHAMAQFSPAEAVQEDLERLKKRISNIGPLNLAAPQEHEELSQKLDFLTQQQNDLLKAKDDLRQVITKINATTREHFRDTFEKVRINFKTLYSQVFQGGDADLRLTDDADILSAGIDIYCQPPGKKVMHISLLSGGEKALTACALLFAFFQVRPSPLALLDEVDAPLDEANILRFVDLVKMFSEKSQFLLISHNKRTMEAANTLYGVTMEELGVSKILSARLAKDKKKIEESIDQKETVAVS